ncbi:MAG TPA: beta-phosphoglucomutase, partial [Anaerolineae bacterium]|nr:beta-phosphoglucomutase [Anaerolineae bacterium]
RYCIADSPLGETVDIGAFIFDLDGVLTDTAQYHYLAWKQLADEEGIPFTREDNEALRGVSRRRSLELLLAGRPVTEEQAEEMMARKNRYYREMLSQLSPADLLPGAKELLDELHAAGLRIVVASASKNAREVIQRLQIDNHIDALADGYSVQRQKPAPDLFLYAAQQVDALPEQCIVVEDAASGIAAGRAAGMWTIGLGPHERVGLADLVYPSLEGVHLDDVLSRLAAGGAWTIRETDFEPERLHHKETVFTIGNGYFGTRGAFEEGYPGAWPATLVHGLFDDAPIVHTELVNVPDWLPLGIIISGEQFRLDRGTLLYWERRLDMRTGVLIRALRWRSPKGYTVDLRFERVASMANPHLAALRCQVSALDFTGPVELQACLNGHVDNQGLVHWDHLAQGATDENTIFLHSRTRGTAMEFAAAAHFQVVGADDVAYHYHDCAGSPMLAARFTLASGQTASAEKLVALWTSRETDDVSKAALDTLRGALSDGYARLRQASDVRWEEIWGSSNVVIEGDDLADRAVRYNLFQLLITAPWHDDHVSIGAKTLSGFGYRGHVFWDTEVFVVPFFAYTQPQVARNLLLYRYHTLEGARRKAREAGYEGAMYAWESAATGDETTPRWVPGPDGELIRIWCGDIELHITADVAYAIWHYWQVTGDDEFMRDHGAEIILDTAVFWGSRVEYDTKADRYELTDVIGPDEYHEHVNNNAFTNRMVQWHLKTALETLAWLRRAYPAKADELVARLGLTEERLSHWADIIGCMYVPYDPESGLIEQFDGFFSLEELDWEALEPRKRSVQALLGIERTNQIQAVKQPDALMLLFLLRDQFDDQSLQTNWAYYAPRTDHTYGSSLGPAVHAILACWQGMPNVAYEHFMRAALVDLDDVRGNAAEGIHGASAGGVWQALAFGFAGLSLTSEGVRTQPSLPAHWRRLRFTVVHQGGLFPVELTGRGEG